MQHSGEPQKGRSASQRQGVRAEAELRTVLEVVETPILILNAAGKVRFANSAFAQLFSISMAQLQQIRDYQALAKLLDSRFLEPGLFALRHLGQTSAPSLSPDSDRDEFVLQHPTRKVVERRSHPISDSLGNNLGWLEAYRDITGQRQIDSKLLQTERMAALGQLVSGIAHELNNPLTTIMGYGQILLGRGLPDAQLSEARKIFQEAERARRIVKNLLFFARGEKPQRSPVDLNELVERTLALRSYELKIENIQAEAVLAPDLPRTLADPYQLQQIILNLIVNSEQAILHSRGEGHIWIRTYRAAPGRIGLDLSDDGPGIPPEVAARMFDPFFTTKPPGVGTGLGLSIVYGIVQEHSGEINFENRAVGGARFIIELPLRNGSPPEPVAERAEPFSAASHPRPARVLVVEDEPTVAQLIAEVLEEDGHQVATALDSAEGLARISRRNFDLVICDLRMPRLDGQAFYESLVRAASPAQHRIIFITGDTLAPRTLEFLQSHRLPYLAKPFLVEELKLAVSRILQCEPANNPRRPSQNRSRRLAAAPHVGRRS